MAKEEIFGREFVCLRHSDPLNKSLICVRHKPYFPTEIEIPPDTEKEVLVDLDTVQKFIMKRAKPKDLDQDLVDLLEESFDTELKGHKR